MSPSQSEFNATMAYANCRERMDVLTRRANAVVGALKEVLTLDELEVGDQSVFAEDNPDHALTRAWALLHDLKVNPL